VNAPRRARRGAAALLATTAAVLPGGCFTAMLWNPHEFGRGEIDARVRAHAVLDDGVTVPLTPPLREALGETLPPEAAAGIALRFERLGDGAPGLATLLASAPRSPDPALQLYVAPDRTITGVVALGQASVPGRVDALASLPAGLDATQRIDLGVRRRFPQSSATTRAIVTPLTVALDVATSPIQLLVVLLRR
jgi:hypothetical protein